MVELRDLSLDYTLPRGGRVPALADVNVLFPEGSVSAILGPSGCGKTSLLHAAAGLRKPRSGEVRIDGKVIGGIRKHTAIIFQDYGLLPWKTAEANAELPLRIAGLARAEAREKVRLLLEEFGLASTRTLYPRELSGGMKQRLAIIRALAPEPDLLLMDEPFSSLDALTREDAQDFLLSIRQKRRLTIVIVTHSIEEAVYLSDEVYVMTGKNPGTVSARFGIERRDKAAFDGGFRGERRFYELCETLRNYLASSGSRS